MNEYTLIRQDVYGHWKYVDQSDDKALLSFIKWSMINSGKHRTEIAIVKTENLSHYIERGE